MWALFVATIYFGSILAIGLAARFLLARLMSDRGVDLADVHALAGPNRPKRKVFLLGAWREEG
jgi:hypothetical protein